MNRCDFCLSDPVEQPTKVYKRDPSIAVAVANWADGTQFIYGDGQWLACRICSEMIDNNLWNQLLARVRVALLQVHNLRATNANLNEMERRARLVLKTIFADRVAGRL